MSARARTLVGTPDPDSIRRSRLAWIAETRISRPCYDKMHRCPGWAGGGTLSAKVRRCDNGSLSWDADGEFVDIYGGRWWRWRFNRCGRCGVLVLPYVVRWLDWRWWGWQVSTPARRWQLWRRARQTARQAGSLRHLDKPGGTT